ncbi:hypothetical protein C8F04DRAFT_1099682 [Mycena alexandri]|uniref:Angiogenic factor with G patch and FHA domains 1 n=1 Tax=Mycena alexandri TaxID=1745969 RepID=A0AAD6SX02_9AGAR|nr:hypothetical protein C8F04DRAFT_1099682 [Mycena alexandri]
MEAGEIAESRSASPNDQGYDPSLEWPGDDGEEPAKVSDVGQSTRPSLRLLVLRSSVLPAKQTLAITEGYTELQFGRDIASSQDSPRVSKFHATAYSDNDSWHIVDMGSKHGTFLQPRSSTTAIRLSPPRVASVPRRLHHLDTLAIGSTTFLVHIHPERAPCDDCCSTFENEIPLFASNKRKAAKVPEPDAGYLPATSGDPKKALTMLKQRLLTSSSPGPARSETSYTDRSARRRSLYPASRLDAPGIAPAFRTEPPPTPLPTTNIGHRLLLAQGWTPGSSLGTSEDHDEGRIRLTAPLEVTSTSQRAGIGMGKAAATTSDGWREDGRQRRWLE